MHALTSSRRVRLGLAVVVLAGAMLAVAGSAVDATDSSAAASRDVAGEMPAADVPFGLVLRLTPDEVAKIVQTRLPDARIERISARPLLSQVRTVEPNAGGPPPGRDAGPVWIVRARGSFVGRHVPPGLKPIRSDTGYFLIADSTGKIFGMGLP